MTDEQRVKRMEDLLREQVSLSKDKERAQATIGYAWVFGAHGLGELARLCLRIFEARSREISTEIAEHYLALRQVPA